MNPYFLGGHKINQSNYNITVWLQICRQECWSSHMHHLKLISQLKK
jgi:hypothetical protein